MSENAPLDMFIQGRFRFAQADLNDALQIAKDAKFLDTDNEDWSDCADAQADLSLRRAHMWEGTFFQVVVYVSLSYRELNGGQYNQELWVRNMDVQISITG